MNDKKNGLLNDIIQRSFNDLTTNNFKTLGMPDEPIWDRPFFGVAAGDDSYFDFLKEHIGEFYWSPAEAFKLRTGRDVPADKLRVVSVVFPQTELTKNMQNTARIFPCDRWVISRGEWEMMMREYSAMIENRLNDEGIDCAAIDFITEFKRMNSENLGIASMWSHRHTAFVAGLGTFGLSDGFITEKGIAIRLTSYIVEADFEVTDRGDRGPYDWCLYYAKGTCGACVKRCPVDAITKENGHDKQICFDYEDEAVEKYWPEHIDKKDYIFGCGLCQSMVPCRDKKPV